LTIIDKKRNNKLGFVNGGGSWGDEHELRGEKGLVVVFKSENSRSQGGELSGEKKLLGPACDKG